MSVEAMAIVLHHSKARGTDKVILLGIANHAGDGGAWPSMSTLARYANVTERAAQDAVRRLSASGEIVVHLQGGGLATMKHWQRPNRYDVTLACPASCDRTTAHRLAPVPQSPSDLWIDGVKPTAPGEAHFTGGVKPTSPEGVKPTSPEPSTQPSINAPSSEAASLTTARGSQAARTICVECGLVEAECQRRSAVSGHVFEARVMGAHRDKRSNGDGRASA